MLGSPRRGGIYELHLRWTNLNSKAISRCEYHKEEDKDMARHGHRGRRGHGRHIPTQCARDTGLPRQLTAMTDTLFLICNDNNEAEEDKQACILELHDKVQVLLDWCSNIVELYHLPSPLLATIGVGKKIH